MRRAFNEGTTPAHRAHRLEQSVSDALQDLIVAMETARVALPEEVQEFSEFVAERMEQAAQVIRDTNKPRPH